MNLLLGSHLATIHETLEVLDQTLSSSSFDNKVTWEDVIKMAEQVSKQATTGTFNSFFSILIQLNLSLYLHVISCFVSISTLSNAVISDYVIE